MNDRPDLLRPPKAAFAAAAAATAEGEMLFAEVASVEREVTMMIYVTEVVLHFYRVYGRGVIERFEPDLMIEQLRVVTPCVWHVTSKIRGRNQE